jgi:hypothetical protein
VNSFEKANEKEWGMLRSVSASEYRVKPQASSTLWSMVVDQSLNKHSFFLFESQALRSPHQI